MSRVTVEFVGGLHDGYMREFRDAPDWMWLEPRETTPRWSDRPVAGWHPYFVVISARSTELQQVERRTSYLYAGHSHVVCGECGAFHALRDEDGRPVHCCAVCGTELHRRARA